jgi:hypothetical protein
VAKAKRIFLEVVLPAFIQPSRRWVFEDRIRESLVAAQIGDVTGGGGGGGTSNIDLEVTDVPAALEVISRVMREFKQHECARGVVVNQYQPVEIVHRLEEWGQDTEPASVLPPDYPGRTCRRTAPGGRVSWWHGPLRQLRRGGELAVRRRG